MEVLNIKIEQKLLKEIDTNLARHRYSTRSEFVRDAIREKLSELEKEELLKKVAAMRGISKHKTTDKQLHEAREKLAKLFYDVPVNTDKDSVKLIFTGY